MADSSDPRPTPVTAAGTPTLTSGDLLQIELEAAPVELSVENAETRIRQLYASETDYAVINTKSSITHSQLSDIQTLFNIPKEYKLRVPEASERMYHRPEGEWVAVHLYALRYGVRFPLHEFISSFLCLVGIGFSQLAPNSYIQLISFIALCQEAGITPGLDFFFVLFSVGRSKEPGLRHLNRVPGRDTFVKTPSSNKGWHSQWFFMRGTDLNLLPNWAGPEDVPMKVNKFPKSRSAAFKKFYALLRQTNWGLGIVSNESWLYEHGCKLIYPTLFSYSPDLLLRFS